MFLDRSKAITDVDVTVVGGAGHVGIPLVLCFAASGFRVMVNDRNSQALDLLGKGKLPFIENDAEPLLASALAANALRFGTTPRDIGRSGPVVITIGTPVDEFLNPILTAVKECIDELLPNLADGQLLVLRSTVYPGTTDWLDRYVKQQGRRLKVAFCPERVVQGQGISELRSLPQLISATSPEAEEEAALLFSRIVPEVVRIKPLEAELAKLFSNVHRYVEFATTNQFYMIAQSAGADYSAILHAMKRNYPRSARIPGPGFAAGPCLFKDTMQLAAFSRNQFALGHASMLVNEGLVFYVLEQLRRDYDLSRLTVGLLGMAFKPEIDDRRASLSYKLKKLLVVHAKKVLTTDPYVKDDPDLIPVSDVVKDSDILILCTPHKAYKELDIDGKPVIDVWDFMVSSSKSATLPRAEESPPQKVTPTVDIVIPVYNEGSNILGTLSAIDRSMSTAARVLICYDFEEDDTLTAIREKWRGSVPVEFVRNQRRGAHGAVMSGLRASTAPYIVVYPADDDFNAEILDGMVAKAKEGNDIVCASRFMPGGNMIGCPWLKSVLVRGAAVSLHRLAKVPTYDPTNGFRLFSRRAIELIRVESTEGFSFSLELLVKAHRLGWRIGEVPAKWFERRAGQSRFKILRWLPSYLKWYFFAFGTRYGRRTADSVALNDSFVHSRTAPKEA